MDKSNLELFKQAIIEGLSQKFDSVVNNYTDEIVCSEKHNIAMRTIVYGKTNSKRTCSSKMKLIAILVAAALLLTSCGIIFRNEIREIFEEFFVKLTYSSDDTGEDTIDAVYQLGYLPEGYSLSNEIIRPLRVQYEYVNEKGDYIWFEQRIVYGSDFIIDTESGYSKIIELKDYDVYYKNTDKKHAYIWNDGKYSMKLSSSTKLSDNEIVLLLEGIIK